MPKDISQVTGLVVLNLILIAGIIFLAVLVYGSYDNRAYRTFVYGFLLLIAILVALVAGISYFIYEASERIDENY